MKLLLCLSLLIFSSLSFAETIYVRKTVTEAGVTAAEGDKVREALRNAVTTQGHKLVSTPGQAPWTIRAVVSKGSNNSYIVKVERLHSGALVGTNHGSDASLDEAVRLATSNLVEALGKSLPEKTTQTVSVTPAVSAETRDVAVSADIPAPAVEAKHPNYIKNWEIALGPVVSNSLIGTNGTKFGLTFSYSMGLSEHFNLLFIQDNNFNTASVGGTAVQTFGAGIKWYFFDRLSDLSPYILIDAGFGGGNRNNDATETGAGAIGLDVYRTQPATFTIYLRNMTMLTNNGSSLSNYPNITQFMLGINF